MGNLGEELVEKKRKRDMGGSGGWYGVLDIEVDGCGEIGTVL
jgi:hypothetical protein